MQHLETITEDEMVAQFLRTELHSVRFEEALLNLLARDGMDRRVIDAPDLGSPEENAYRLRLLGEYRGYRRREGIFQCVPADVTWHRFAMSVEELAKVRYIDYCYWNRLSGGSRLPLDAARNIRSGIIVYGQSTECYLGLARELEAGARFPELILVGREGCPDLVVLEGHVRLTSYFVAPHCIPEPLPVIIGLSPTIEIDRV